MRTISLIVVAMLLAAGGGSPAFAQESNAARVGVSREQLVPVFVPGRLARDTSDATPKVESRTRSNAKIGALVGAYVGVVISALAYKKCGDSQAQSEKVICGIELMVVAPLTIGGGALFGGLLGRARPSRVADGER
jgi:hypothetical protein